MFAGLCVCVCIYITIVYFDHCQCDFAMLQASLWTVVRIILHRMGNKKRKAKCGFTELHTTFIVPFNFSSLGLFWIHQDKRAFRAAFFRSLSLPSFLLLSHPLFLSVIRQPLLLRACQTYIYLWLSYTVCITLKSACSYCGHKQKYCPHRKKSSLVGPVAIDIANGSGVIRFCVPLNDRLSIDPYDFVKC